MKNQYVFVAVGAPASGKSRFYHQVANDNDWGMGELPVYISSDGIRMELFGSEDNQSDPDRVFRLLRDRAAQALYAGRSVYLDATHAKKDWRKYALDLAQIADATCVALYFDVPFWTLLKRDRLRARHVGFKVLLRYVRTFEPPTLSEGFHAIFHVDRYGQYSIE